MFFHFYKHTCKDILESCFDLSKRDSKFWIELIHTRLINESIIVFQFYIELSKLLFEPLYLSTS